MSFSFTLVGKVDAINRALEAKRLEATGPTRTELDEAVPALQTLVGQNIGRPEALYKLDASGHAQFDATTGARVTGQIAFKCEGVGYLVE